MNRLVSYTARQEMLITLTQNLKWRLQIVYFVQPNVQNLQKLFI